MTERKEQPEICDQSQDGDALDAALGIAFGAPLLKPRTDETCTHIGRYKVLEQIGEGGFGVVYMAEQQEPIRRRVALKIIKLGMDTKQVIARFEAERQALALMSHENIASVLDAGTTETGRPYFVMELVRGVPITDYCDRNKLNTTDRLKLFVSVCKAVQHAHQKGIIHRDLKPSNVMVTLRDGVPIPKVIDFGIAKATQARLTEKTVFTRFGQFIGTPAYTSPEQIEMSELDADTRSDIYSLGVLLYELLTGTTPIEQEQLRRASYVEMQRMICEEEPPKPSTRLSQSGELLATISAQRSTDPKRLGQLVRGELDWIVMKSLEKDRTRRYETANGLATDVLRYLNDEPVLAGPPSATYRLRKFVHRNHKLVGTVALFVLMLLIGTVISTWQAYRASQAEKQAEDQRDFAKKISDSLLEEKRKGEAADRVRQRERVAALITAAPESVPLLIGEIRSSKEDVLPLIRSQFDKAVDKEERLRLGIARTLLDEPVPQFLAESVPTAHPKEFANLQRAFRVCEEQSVTILKQQLQSADDPAARFRFAVLLLELGSSQAAAELLTLKADPTTRSRFIHGLENWHGDLAAIPRVLAKERNGALQSGLAIALGRLDPKTISADVYEAIKNALIEMYLTADDSGTHSACGWALQRWGVKLPAIATAPTTGNRRWFVNAGGQTMLMIDADSPPEAPAASAPAFPYPFAISDREVSLALFRRFLDDPNCPENEKPKDWPGVNRQLVPSDDCPVHYVGLVDCMLFCNWLSRTDSRLPCYVPDNEGRWWCHFDRDGYRMPAADEWEHTCYTGSKVKFPFGNDELLLLEYGNLLVRRTQPGGRFIPNNWGAFDMFGNVWDMCHYQNFADVVPNPKQPSIPTEIILRGGTYGEGSYHSNRDFYRCLGDRSPDAGFRVVCRIGPTSDGLQVAESRLTAWWQSQLTEQPGNIQLRMKRVNLQIRNHQWKGAAADYQSLVQLQPNDVGYWMGAAVLLAEVHDVDSYRQICQEMLGKFGNTSDPLVADKVSKSCLLLPEAMLEPEALYRLADQAVSENSPKWAKPYTQTLKGFADYRAGKFPEAIKRLETNRTIMGGKSFILDLNLAVLAMAYHKSGDTEQAKKVLAEFVDHVDSAMQDTSGAFAPMWMELLFADVVTREAKRLIW